MGSRPRNTGTTTTTSQQFRARSYQIYQEIPDVLKDIKKPEIFRKRLKRYYANNDDLPENRIHTPHNNTSLMQQQPRLTPPASPTPSPDHNDETR